MKSMEKKPSVWKVYTKKANFDEIAKKHNISPITARIMCNRDIVEDSEIEIFLNGQISDLNNPFDMADMNKAVELLKNDISGGNKIRIMGDYDTDGICSSVILYKILKSMGADADIDIPDRINDGYGINNRMIDDAYKSGVRTILTCDNGIAASKQVLYAKEKGIKVIVTDHHEVPFEENNDTKTYLLPPADATVDPKRADCPYSFKEMCGAGIAYRLGQAIGADREVLGEALVFAAIATICDIVDLKTENRIIVKEGLSLLNNDKNINTGLYSLIKATGLADKKINTYNTGFVLGPCINASGRLGSAKMAVELFLESDKEKALKLATELATLNADRKEMTEKMAKLASEKLKTEYCGESVAVIYIPECHESVAGIVASRIKDMIYRPTFIITNAENGEVKGSGRSVEAYNMYSELTKCANLLTKFGGHAMAAGFSLLPQNINSFRDALNQNAALTDKDLTETIWIDIPMYAEYADEKLIKELETLQPFGKGNKKAMFADRELTVVGRDLLGDKKNVLRLSLKTVRGNTVKAVYFPGAENKENLPDVGQKISVLYYPQINEYAGRKSIQLSIIDYRICEES